MTITASQFLASDPCVLTSDVEDGFFTSLRTENNTFKRTASDRFSELDARCIQHFARTGTMLRTMLDIGISSGSTTLAISDRLRAAGHTPHITGTDLALSGYLVAVSPRLLVFIDEQGHPLQYELFGRAVRAWGRRADYITGYGVLRRLLRALSASAIDRALAGDPADLRPIALVTPRLRGRTDIHILKDDVFCYNPAFARKFDFIRVANILNRGYFDDDMLHAALHNIVQYLAGPGAWLLVARSSGRETAATLFRVSPDGRQLSIRDRTGAGSEIEDIVLATTFPLQAAAP